jgi:hypothetical protein
MISQQSRFVRGIPFQRIQVQVWNRPVC